jgi:hypothetical protein
MAQTPSARLFGGGIALCQLRLNFGPLATFDYMIDSAGHGPMLMNLGPL